jgi:hypothetical protein
VQTEFPHNCLNNGSSFSMTNLDTRKHEIRLVGREQIIPRVARFITKHRCRFERAASQVM